MSYYRTLFLLNLNREEEAAQIIFKIKIIYFKQWNRSKTSILKGLLKQEPTPISQCRAFPSKTSPKVHSWLTIPGLLTLPTRCNRNASRLFPRPFWWKPKGLTLSWPYTRRPKSNRLSSKLSTPHKKEASSCSTIWRTNTRFRRDIFQRQWATLRVNNKKKKWDKRGGKWNLGSPTNYQHLSTQ